ncbi:PRC-barrel domain-containing protein [Burkholderia oklahomensis]|uniref:PRC-barrel domain protein n=1 Tax=Burkholderia oklahomensis TaxID=342113 RepID=A0AAI8BEU8_9BURK|nr:PRC-barrel domain-containing protein [Burkholderia oklahomensis]AIO71017.1 PRC-barrel domain protein [Burkholderia oklahomensis]AJX35039.1 PRC-barrel domain protein [Burkholderia oklahomensis C6786]AOI38955.1 photosystem reaction center subunit H [Burkholderia oklahomensis EO147]AOI48657.1 photosystem reaction center subunit H [Burkholderia oklahomensis C6786]KUY47443.1 photosystem reaction center subunit H [Burkholderia oklahomensis C6786]
MLRSIRKLHGVTVRAKDGDIGHVNQAYFDDDDWCIRYLVVETGDWLHDRQVLISPYSVKPADPGSGTLHVSLTQQQVRDSPNLDAHKPVSRQHEIDYLRYYNYPTYWGGPNLWGMGAYPAFDPAELSQDLEAGNPVPTRATHAGAPTDTHLRSTSEVKGYRLETMDGSIGHVSDFIYDDEAWVIRYLTVDTRSWWSTGNEVLVATHWLDRVDWSAETVSTTLTRDAVRQSPAYDDSQPVHRSYEIELHRFYGKHGYWSETESSTTRDTL